MISTSRTIAEVFIGELEPIFPNAKNRLRVWADVDKFNWKEDEDIWKQQRGLNKKEYEIYFDREFITSFSESDEFPIVRNNFFKAMRDLYKSGKIFVHEQMYAVKDEEEKQKRLEMEKAELESIPQARNAQEELVRDVIIRSKKRKKHGK